MEKSTLNRLKKIAGKESVLTSPEDLVCYSFDGTPLKNFKPEAVIVPNSAEEISQLCRFAREEKIFIIPRGSGTGLSGGSVPAGGGIVLSLTKLNRITDIDLENLTVTVQSGVITENINKALEPFGFFYPPDPASMKISTIGGNVAENSGGLRGLKYGVTEDYVLGIETVFSNGEILNTNLKTVKNVAGYNLNKLLVGSEGTLGIFTEILLKIIPVPEYKKTLLVQFKKLNEAAFIVQKIIASKIIPATLEFLDSKTIQSVDDYSKIGFPKNVGALLLIELDGNKTQVEDDAVKVIEICKTGNCMRVDIARDETEALKLTEARRSALSALARQKPTTILEDVTVPRSELVEMVEFIEYIANKYNIIIGTFGHIGDGNLHPTCLTDERDEGELKRVRKAFDEIFEKTLILGGTVSGEHGIGLSKKNYLEKMIGTSGINIMKKIKNSFDPEGILNPGKIF